MSDRDRKLAELMGMCWHEWVEQEKKHSAALTVYACYNCPNIWFGSQGPPPENPDFSTPEWRARLMDWAVEQEWYWDFEEWIDNEKFPDTPEGIMFTQYLWRNLPELVDQYWRKKL